MNKKTGRKAAGKKWKEASEISGLNPAEQEQAALYLNKVIKYLIVPENAEIPAGLDKEVIVVRQPADHVYAGSNKTISLMEELPEKRSIKKAAKKKMTAYRKMTEKMTLLQIPVIVDRAKDEKGKDAQKEWEKVYQVILGCDGQSAE